MHFSVCHTRVPSPSNLCITQHVSESTPRTSSCVCQSLTCTHDPVNVLRHMLSFRLPPKAAKYGSDGQTCGVDRLVSTGCRFHSFTSPCSQSHLVLLLQSWFQNCAFLLQRLHYVSTFSTGPPQRFKSQLPPAPPTEYLHLSALAYYYLYYPFPLEYVDPY